MERTQAKPRARKPRAKLAAGSLKDERRKEFLARWIPYGMNLFARAEAYGLDWNKIPMEQLSATIILTEEWARPSDYQDPFTIQYQE